MKTDHAKKPFYTNPSILLSYQLPKIYLHFQTKKSLIKPDRFDFKSLPNFPATMTPPPLSSHTFKLKNIKQSQS